MRLSVNALLTALLTTALLGVCAAPSSATWTKPRELEAPGWQASDGARVATVDGWTTVVWVAERTGTADPTIRMRRIRPDGSRTPARTVSTNSPVSGQPALGVDAHDGATIAWASNDPSGSWQVFARHVTRDGSLGPVRHLSRPDQGAGSDWLPTVAVTPRGRALVVWEQPTSGAPAPLEGRVISPSGHLGSLRTFHASTGRTPAPVAACPDESFVVGSIVRQTDLSLLRIRRGGGTTSRNVTRDVPGRVIAASLACDGADGAHVVVTTKRHNSAPYGMVARARVWRRSGRLSAAERISPRGQEVVTIAIGTDGSGDSELGWADVRGSYDYRLHTRRWGNDGALGPVHDLGRVLDDYSSIGLDLPPNIALAVNEAGHGVIAWNRRSGSTGNFGVLARGLHVDGAPTAQVRLAPDAISPAVAEARRGPGLVVYTNRVGSGLDLRTGP